jgi:myosin heavy subunit
MTEELSFKIKIDGQEKVISNMGEFTQALEEAKEKAFLLAQEFGDADERVISLRREAGEMQKKIFESEQAVEAFSKGGGFPAIARSVQGIAAGFSAVQGAIALVGVESEEVEKAILKVQGAMAISDGINTIVENAGAFKQLGTFIKSTTAFRWLDVQATRVAAATQNLFTGAVNTTSTAFKGLKAAIVSTGIGALVVVIGLLISKMMEWSSSTEDVEKATEELNKQLERTKELTDESLKSIDYYTKEQVAKAKIRGASEKELLEIEKNANAERKKILQDDIKSKEQIIENQRKNNKTTYEQSKTANDALREAQKTYDNFVAQERLSNYEKEATQAEQNRKDKIEKQKQYNEKQKALAEKQKAELEAIQNDIYAREDSARAVQIQAELDAKTERDQALYQAEAEYEERRKTLLRANNTDFTKIDEAYRIKQKEINDKYDKEDSDKANEKAAKERELAQIQLQAKLDSIDEENAKIEYDFEQDLERLNQKREILAEAEQVELSNTQLTEVERTNIRDKYAKERKDITNAEVETEEKAQEYKKALNDAYLDFAGQVGATLQQIAGENKTLAIAGVIVEQVASISKIISNTAAANAKSVAASPLTAGMPWVGINTASAAISIGSTINGAIKTIGEIKKQKGAEGQGNAAGSVGNLSAPMTAQAPQPNTTLIDQQSINALGNQAIRTYVVESDLTTNQQRIEAIRQRARFS